MSEKTKRLNGLQLKPKTTVTTLEGETRVDYTTKTFRAYLDGSERTLVTEDQTQTLTNKTHTDPVLNGDVSGTAIDIDDTLAADSDTKIASQKAVKKYIDDSILAHDDASEVTYTPNDLTDWTGDADPGNVDGGLDQLAERLKIAETSAGDNATAISDHITDTSDAHDASAISTDNSGNSLTSTEAQASFTEVAGRLDSTESATSTNTTKTGNLETLSGEASGSTDHGTFTGTTISDNATTRTALQELETELETKVGGGDLSTHESDTSTHGVGEIVGTTETQTLTNKTFDDELTSKELAATPSNPAAGYKKIYPKNDGKLYSLDSAGNEVEIGSGTGGGGSTQFEITQASHGFAVGNGIYHNGTTWVKAQADASTTLAYYVIIAVADVNTFTAADFGRIEATAHGYTIGEYYFQSDATPGLATLTEPSSGFSNPLFFVEDVNTLQVKCLRPDAIGGINLDDLDDTSVPAPTDGQVLAYDTGNTRWEAKDPVSAAADVTTDNSGNSLTAVEAQATFDEVAGRIDSAETNITSNDTDIRELQKVKNINHIPNPDLEVDTTGYTGDTNLVISRETTNVLRGTGSLKIAKAAIDASTQSVTIPFTVDTTDLAQMMTIVFDKDFSHADYADGDAQVRIIQDPSGSPTTIRVNGEDILGGKGQHIAQFQTDATELDYALEIYWNDSGTNAVDVYMDNIQVGPRAVQKGAAMSDWESYDIVVGATTTPPTFGTNTKEAYWRRVGDNLEVKFTINQTSIGTAGSGTYYFGLPPVGTVDEDKLTTNFGLGLGAIGSAHAYDNSVGELNGIVRYDNGNIILQVGDQNSASAVSSGYAETSSDNVMRYSATYSVPIKGWSSNTVLSEDIGNRKIVVRASENSGNIITANTERINFNTIEEDTTGSWGQNGGNGNNEFTCPESGDYLVSGILRTSSSALMDLQLYVDGVKRKTISYKTTIIHDYNTKVSLLKGQKMSLRMATTQTLSTSGGSDYHNIYIAKLSNPQTILETETIAAYYTSTNGQAITTAYDIIKYETLGKDTHSAYDTSTGLYTIPASGWYTTSYSFVKDGSSRSRLQGKLVLNGVENFATSLALMSSAAGQTLNARNTITRYFEKGDEIGVHADVDTTNVTMNVAAGYNFFSIIRQK